MKVVVAMSGGVDSSVAAALLKQEGHDVIGMMMRLWSEPGSEAANRCCTPDAMAQARGVAAALDIPFYAIDGRDVFHTTVVNQFIDGYALGDTPNPCLTCNRHVRWEFLLNRALAIGADFMATGHYVRLDRSAGNVVRILRGVDQRKDQSYILHVLGQKQLAHAVFPLGMYTKTEVRQLARDFALPVAERPESQDLCFLGSGDYRSFLLRNSTGLDSPGPIINQRGDNLGQHKGLAFYTVGQRKGLGISANEPVFVLKKDIKRNTLIVGYSDELGRNNLVAAQVNWVSSSPGDASFPAGVQIRYHAQEVACVITPLAEDRVHVQLNNHLRDITPGQAAVFYLGEECIGGGIIQPEENAEK